MQEKEIIPSSAPAQEDAAPLAENAVRRTPECLVDSGSVLEGDLSTTDDVLLVGRLDGNLTSVGTVRVTGTVNGDVSGKRVDLLGGTINGNITAEKSIQIEKGSRVTGNLKAATASLKAGAYLRGDVRSGMACIEFGAVFHGKLDAEQDN